MALPQFVIVTLIVNQAVIGLAQNTDLKLKLLHVIFRHGEKVPERQFQNYPNDPHRNHSYFPIDNGDLTNAGKRRMYELGRKLRLVYGSFLGDYYLPSEVYTRSSDISRSEMALQLVLAGLFPPVGEQIWLPSFQWQPISFKATPHTRDLLFFPSKCSLNSAAMGDVIRSDAVAKIVGKYDKYMEYIANQSGKPINSLLDVIMLHNLFEEQTAHNLTLPDWTKKVYPHSMKEMSTIYFNLHSYSKELRRYNGGFLLYEFTQQMQKHIAGTINPSNRKAFIYSAHDSNIIALARVLKLYYPIYPKFGSTFLIETLQDRNNRYYIKILLWTGGHDQVIIQPLPECGNPCPLDVFLEKYKEVIPTNEEVMLCREEIVTNTRPSS